MDNSKKALEHIAEAQRLVGLRRIGTGVGPGSNQLAAAVVSLGQAEAYVVEAERIQAEQTSGAVDESPRCGKPCNCPVDAQTGTPWSIGSLVSGSDVEERWLERHRAGTADGSGHAE